MLQNASAKEIRFGTGHECDFERDEVLGWGDRYWLYHLLDESPKLNTAPGVSCSTIFFGAELNF